MKFDVIIDLTDEECYWKGGKYKFSVVVPLTYPYEAPKPHCDTQIYHPNIDMQGAVCLNILRKDWKPVLGINAVFFGLICLFLEPNPDDPLNHQAAELMRDDLEAFKKKVRQTLRGGVHEGAEFPRLI